MNDLNTARSVSTKDIEIRTPCLTEGHSGYPGGCYNNKRKKGGKKAKPENSPGGDLMARLPFPFARPSLGYLIVPS